MFPPFNWKTKRLDFRPPTPDDAPYIFNYASNTKVCKYLSWPPHQALKDTNRYLKSCFNRWQDRSELTWVIHFEKKFIGMLALRISGFKADFGYVFHPDFWGNGFATEAVLGLKTEVFKNPSIYRFFAVCDVENLASARVLEKAGLEFEGILRAYLYHPNISRHPRDVKCYSSIRKDLTPTSS